MSIDFDKTLHLKELISPDLISELFQSMANLYKVPLKVFDEQDALIFQKAFETGNFCQLIFSDLNGQKACTKKVTEVKIAKPLGEIAESHDCFSGLRYQVSPIYYQGEYLGRIILGPYWPKELSVKPKSMSFMQAGFNFENLKAQVNTHKTLSEGQIDLILRHITTVLDILFHASHKSWLTSKMHLESISASYKELENKNKMLEESVERMKEVDKLKSNFLATMSHELRTPLTSIIGYAEMLAEQISGELNSLQKTYTNNIIEKGENLLSMINAVLEISRNETQKLALNKVTVDVVDLVQNAVSTVFPQAQKKNIGLKTYVDENLPPCKLDKERMSQALINLLSNSTKFTQNGGIVTIHAFTSREPIAQSNASEARFFDGKEPYICISVTDNGIGIPEEHLDKIFHSFYQVDNQQTRNFGGAGIGLALVKTFVEAHQGFCKVESKVQKGSKFSLFLPIER